MKAEQLVTFAILMGAGDRIIDKSPKYILDKFEACNQFSSEPFLRGTLDRANRAIFDAWMRKWTAEVYV